MRGRGRCRKRLGKPSRKKRNKTQKLMRITHGLVPVQLCVFLRFLRPPHPFVGHRAANHPSTIPDPKSSISRAASEGPGAGISRCVRMPLTFFEDPACAVVGNLTTVLAPRRNGEFMVLTTKTPASDGSHPPRWSPPPDARRIRPLKADPRAGNPDEVTSLGLQAGFHPRIRPALTPAAH